MESLVVVVLYIIYILLTAKSQYIHIFSATLPDHPGCYRDIKRKLKRLKNNDYPNDLFINVHDKCVFSISTVWDEFLVSKEKKK